jgi:two-component system sensor histidine kinase BaeS
LEETRLLTRLVNDLQTLSLAESGQLPLHLTRFRMSDLLQDITFSFASQAAAQGVELAARLAEPAQEVSADYDRLNQVISNLIANSLRYTPRGGKISVVIERGTRGEKGVRISVEDDGSGIAAEDLPFIFDRFWRADKSRSERAHSGLGLAITRQLVQAHGGTIEVVSQLARGTRFVIELPAEIPPNER